MSAKNDLLAYIHEHIDEMSDDHAAQLQKMAERLVKLKHNGGVVMPGMIVGTHRKVTSDAPIKVTFATQNGTAHDLSPFISGLTLSADSKGE